MLHTHKPQTEDALKAMRERNEKRAAIVTRVMGTKHLCHPVNHVHRRCDMRNRIVCMSDVALNRLMIDIATPPGLARWF